MTLSTTVTEFLAILGLTATDLPERIVEEDAPETDEQRARRAMIGKWETAFGADPVGAEPRDKERLEEARRSLRNVIARSSSGTKSQMTELKDNLEHLSETYREVVSLVEERGKLLERLLELVPDTGEAVPGATVQEAADLVEHRNRLTAAIKAAGTLKELEEVSLTPLVEAIGSLVATVQGRREKKAEIQREADSVTQPEGCETNALQAERDQVRTALEASPLGDDDLKNAAKKLDDLRSARDTIEAELAPLRRLRVLLKAQVEDVRNTFEFCLGKAPVKSTERSKVVSSINKCENLLKYPLRTDNIKKFSDGLWSVRGQISSLLSGASGNKQAYPYLFNYLETECKKLDRIWRELPESSDDVKSLLTAASTQSNLVHKGCALNNQKGLNQAVRNLEDLNTTVNELRGKVQNDLVALSANKSSIEDMIAIDDPKGVAEWFAGKLDEARRRVRDALAVGLTQDAIDAAFALAAKFTALWTTAEADAKAAAEVAAAKLRLATSFAPAHDMAWATAKKELDRAKAAAEAHEALAGEKRDMAGAANLYKALEARVAEVASESKTDRPTFAGEGLGAPPEESVVTEMVELCGPKLLSTLGETEKTALYRAMKAKGKEINALVINGLGGDPKILGAILGKAGPDGLAELAIAFEGDEDAGKALAGLVESGGLAEHPEALAEMLRHGVDGADDENAKRRANAETLKAMVAAFAGEDGQAAMRGMLEGAGLGGGTPPAGPIASLLHVGCNGDAQKLRDFAKAYDGPEAKNDRERLKGLVQTGGIGEHPETLGPLVRRGGAGTLKSLGDAFADPGDLAKLKSLLATGGLAGNDGGKDTRPDTLAKVLVDGFAGDGKKMRQYAQAFSGHEAQSKMMLDAWNEHPDTEAGSRQPGIAIAKLLGGDKLNGNIGALQSKFATEIANVGDVTRRKQAVRFAPYFDKAPSKDNWMAPTKNMTDRGINTITGSILRRHSPRHFDKSKMGNAPLHSQFPPGVNLANLIDEALGKLPLPLTQVDLQRSHRVHVGNPRILVEIGFFDSSTVNHFTPCGLPPGDAPTPPHPREAPPFTTADINCILKSIA